MARGAVCTRRETVRWLSLEGGGTLIAATGGFDPDADGNDDDMVFTRLLEMFFT